MTAGELIAELQQFDENLEVQADAGLTGDFNLTGVELDEGSPDEDPVVVITMENIYG